MRRRLAAALGIACLASLGNGASGPPGISLGTAQQVAGPIDARLVNAGDFDGDGVSDAVVVSFVQEQITLVRGKGSGTFGSDEPYALTKGGGFSVFSRSGDLNGDGALDVVVARIDCGCGPSTDVLLSDGNGGFSLAAYAGTFSDLADWDGDGSLDLLSSNSNNTFTVRTNDGKGNLGAAETITVHGTQPMIVGPCAAADLDGDGDADIALIGGRGNIDVHLRRADGTLDSGVRLSRPSMGFFPPCPTPLLRDFDGDGTIDIAMIDMGMNGKTEWVVYRHADATTFLEGEVYPLGFFGGWTLQAEAADLNGDGLPELVTPSDLLVNRGDGTFAPALVFHGAYPTYGNKLPNCSGVAVADMDGDGTPDVVQVEESPYSHSVGHGTLWIPVTLTAIVRPTITALSPLTLRQGTTADVVLTGTGFTSGAALDFGDGIALNGVTFISAVSVTANVSVSADAALGAHVLTLLNPDCGTATASIEVQPPDPVPVTIVDLVPDRARAGDSVLVTLHGTGFTDGLGVALGDAVAVAAETRIDDTTATFQLAIPLAAAAGPLDLIFTNGTGDSISVPAAFTVLPPRSIDLTAEQGRIRAADRPRRGSLSVSGTFAFNALSPDGTCFLRTESTEVRFGPEHAPIAVAIPAGDRWVLRGKRATWKSPAGSKPSVVLRLDFGKGTFRLDAKRADLRGQTGGDVLVELTLGGETGTSVRAWKRNRAGTVLTLK